VTPYDSFTYFGFLLYPVLPAVLLGLLGRLRPWYVLLATVAMLLLQYADPFGLGPRSTLGFFAAYMVYETAVTLGYGWVRRRTAAPAPYYAAVALALAPLAAVKVVSSLGGGLLRPFGGVLVPGLSDTFGFLGVSYMTFRVVDTLVVVHDGLAPAPPLGTFLNYVMFFPCASAGPIDRYRRFRDDLERVRTSRQYLVELDRGAYRIAQGFLYKFIVAQLILVHWLDPVSASRSLRDMILYMYGYTLYLFFDFAGYSAFAIGVSHLFGVRSPENFRAPFLSRNFRDFWNRWFISLSWFLRDHVYMRFVLAATRRRWFKSRYTASYFGYVLTMGAMGLWHGLQWHYIVYGLYQAAMLIIYDVLGRWNRARRFLTDNRWTRAASVVVTFQLVCFGMLIFSGHLFV
jgi:membrane protein involved in D-alanine export